MRGLDRSGGRPFLAAFIPDEGGNDMSPRAKVKFLVPYFLKYMGRAVALPVGPELPEDVWQRSQFWIGFEMDAFRLGALPEGIEIPERDMTDRSYPGGKPSRATNISSVVKTVTMERIDSLTQELVKESGGKLAVHEARRKVLDENPAWYASYRAETTRHRATGGES